MRVAVWQAPAEVEAGPPFEAVLARAVRAAAAAGAELLVLPELALLGPPGAAGLAPLASASDGAPTRRLGALARASGIAVVTGYLEACSGRLHSSALLIDARGHALANYRRSHLRAGEQTQLSRGAWLSVVPLAGRRLGLLIGYDLRFPEVGRALVLAGADLLVVLGPWPAEPEAEIGPLAAARAIENGVPLAMACWAAQGGAESRLLGPDGASLARAGGGEEPIVGELPPALGREAGLADRRPRLYQELVAGEP